MHRELLTGLTPFAHIHSHAGFGGITDEKFSSWVGGYDNKKDFDIYGAPDGSGMAAKNPKLYLYLLTPAGNL